MTAVDCLLAEELRKEMEALPEGDDRRLVLADQIDEANRRYAPAPIEPAPVTPTIRFISAAELKASTPPKPPFIAEPYVVQGSITIWSGKPKVGKSTVAFGLATAVVTPGARFLGADVVHCPAVYVSEESAATLEHKLPQSDDLRVLTRENAWPKPAWPALLDAAVTEALRVGAKLLIIDTAAYWAGLAAEREKDAGAALATMDALVYAASQGLAVVVPMHTRKGGGEDGEGIRGSSAWAGSADVIVEMDRVPDLPRQRVLLALSRYPQTPGTMVVELDECNMLHWRVVSRDEDRSDPKTIAARNRAEGDRNALLTAVSSGASLTRAELEEAIGAPSRQWHKLLDQLVKDEQIHRSGSGIRGNPYRYEKKLRTETAQADAQSGAQTTIPISAHSLSGNAEMESSSVTAQTGHAATSEIEPLEGESFAEWDERVSAEFGGAA